MAFTADQEQARLAVIDTAANTVKTWVPLPSMPTEPKLPPTAVG